MTLPASALTAHVAIVGNTGAGKSNAAKVAVEGLLDDGRRVAIIDPTGVHFGLRSSADGKGEGYRILVLGGEHGDLPLAPQAGARVAQLIAGRDVPVVLDLSEMLIGDRTRFVTDFAEALYRLNKRPLHLVIDEADEFASQNPMPENRRMLHHVDRIVRRGRVKGFRVMLITQRPAAIHKNVLTQANTLVAMRLPAPQDRKAIEAWVQGHADAAEAKKVLDSLARLKRGEGWVWCPGEGILERTQFPLARTFDSGRTPEYGEALHEASVAARVDLDEIRKALAVEEKPAAAPAAAAAPASDRALAIAYQDGEQNGWKAGRAEARRLIAEELASLGKQIAALAVELDRLIEQMRGVDEVDDRRPAGEAAAPTTIVRHEVKPAYRPTASVIPPGAVARSDLPGAQQRILDALAELSQLGLHRPERMQVALLAGYSHLSSKGFANGIGALRSAGMVEYPEGGRISLSDDGRRSANPPARPRTSSEIHDRFCQLLGGQTERVLRPLIAAYPRALDRARLMEAAGYGHQSSKGFANTIGRLRSLGLIDYPSRGTVAARDILFIGGKR